MVHAFNPSTNGAETSRSLFKVSQFYIVTPCFFFLKKKTKPPPKSFKNASLNLVRRGGGERMEKPRDSYFNFKCLCSSTNGQKMSLLTHDRARVHKTLGSIH